MHIYAIYNKLIGAYNAPLFANEDKDSMSTQYKRYCILNKEDAKKAHFDESELYYLGDFDDITGQVNAVKPEFIIAFNNFFNL